MSLTTVIKDHSHPVTQLVESSLVPEARHVVEEMNNRLAKSTPKGGEFDKLLFPEIGTAMTYAIKDYLVNFSANQDLLEKTIAGSVAIRQGVFPRLLEALGQQHPLRYLAMAELEKIYRTGGESGLLAKGSRLPPDLEESAKDVGVLVKLIPNYLGTTKAENFDIKLAPVFYGSRFISADAQLIVGSTLVEIKTSMKRRPMTFESLVQQLAYVGFNCDNRYQLKNVAWIFPRHQKVMLTPLITLLNKPLRRYQIEFIHYFESLSSIHY